MANFVDVSNALRFPGQEYPLNEDVLVDKMELSGDPIHFTDVSVRGAMVGAEEQVSVRADVAATLVSRCVRCLQPVNRPVQAKLDAVFARAQDPEDPDLYVFEASTIELTDSVRDALLLELPIRILCKGDCAGICPKCGIDRNAQSCACQEGGEVANPFAALKEFLRDDEEV